MKRSQFVPWRIGLRLGALGVICVCSFVGAHAQVGTNRPTSAAIEPAADALLHKMSDKLIGAQQFTVTGKRIMDPALAQGRPVDSEITFELSLRRPNQLTARMEGKETKRSFYYDGAHSTLLDETRNVYATTEGGGTIDAMLDGLHEKYGFTPPMTDFLVQDPYADLTQNVQRGREQGRETVGGVDCHHLVFSRQDADWEVWLATEDLLPRKFVLTQKDLPGTPRLEAEFTKWDLAPPLKAGIFTFQAPQGAEKIEMIPLDRFEKNSDTPTKPQE